MSFVSDTETSPRTLNRGAWLALAFAVIIIVINLSLSLAPLLLPGDGWAYSELAWRAGQAQWTAVRNLSGAPSPLAPGDQVLAIDGQAVETRLAQAFALRNERPPGWVAGGQARYTVLRAGQTLTLDVPLLRLTPGQMLRTFLPGPADLLLSLIQPITLIIALIVFWQRPHLTAAQVMLVFAATLASGFVEVPITTAALMFPALLAAPLMLSSWQFALLPSLLHLLLVFPVVKRPLRQRPFLTVLLLYGSAQALIWLVWVLNWGQPSAVVSLYYAIVGLQAVGLLGLMLVSLAHSWLTAREPAARAQIGWMTFGLIVGFMGSALLWLVATFFFAFTAPWQVASGVLMLALPLGLAVAILRYRLFEIDVLINRALVYGSLTALLALAYFGVVVVLQAVLRALTGAEQSQLVTVISTLAIAALFTPVRARVQAFIDRRFYRRKYDAARTLASFSATMRDDVNLGELSQRLQTVVDDAMQPSHVSLWLKEAPRTRP